MNVPEGVEGRDDAFVVCMPDLPATPSQKVTQVWFEKVKDYLTDDPHVFHDSGGEFTGHTIQRDFHDYDITTHQFPGAAGAFQNPCDSNFIYDLKSHFWGLPQDTYAERLRAMIDAYFLVPDSHIQHYFQHCRITGKMPTRKCMEYLLSEGFRPAKGHKELHQKCKKVYTSWRNNMRILRSDTRYLQSPYTAKDTQLEGVYWHSHHVSKL